MSNLPLSRVRPSDDLPISARLFLVLFVQVLLVVVALLITGVLSRSILALTFVLVPVAAYYYRRAVYIATALLILLAAFVARVVGDVPINPTTFAISAVAALVVAEAVHRQRRLVVAQRAQLEGIAHYALHNPNPTVQFTLAGEVLYQNPTATRAFAFRQRAPDAWLAIAQQAADSRQSVTFDYTENSATPPREYSLHLTYFADSQAALVFGVDVTEQKAAERTLRESEQRYRVLAEQSLSIMDTMGQGLTVSDANSVFQYVNPAYARMLGYTPDALVGKTPYDVSEPADIATLDTSYKQRLSGEASYYEMRLLHKDGHHVYVLITGVPQIFDGKLAAMIAVITDLSERHALEEAMREARDKALEASRLKSEFLAMMSHEIRTPMNAIIGMSELLQDTALDATQRDYVQITQREANALLLIINDILDISKIEAGRLEMAAHDFALRPVFEQVLASFAMRATAKGLRLHGKIDPSLPEMVTGDPGRLRQVLVNLVGNAVKFTHKGEVRVVARPRNNADGSTELYVAIHDTGIGIAAADQARLFEAFVQADSSTTRQYGGTGLGLAISQRLVTMMGGEVGMDSEPDVGSTFWFTMPVDLPAGRTAAPPIDAATTNNATEAGSSTVLVVEDNRVNQRLAQAQLAKLGLNCEVAGSGQDALALLEADAQRIDLVLMDAQMPGMDGLATTRELRRREASAGDHVPIIALTASSMASDRENCLAAGMDDFLSKPVALDALRAMLAKWLPEAAMSDAGET